MSTTFSPTINLNGEPYTPKGWVWILGFALGGCAWAIREASKPEFVNHIRSEFNSEEITRIENQIDRLNKELEVLKVYGD